ncbi:MAG: hypothetical protein IIA44_02355, partial [Acidobacteria bacterium]|nr:hypothetical protein [Acidobacteriota bacterium]
MRRSAALVAALGLVAFLAIVVRDVRAEEPPPPRSGRYAIGTSTSFLLPPKGGKLSSSLARLVEAAARVPDGISLSSYGFGAVSPPTESLLRAGLLRIDSRERAQVYVHVGDLYSAEDVVGGLEALGGVVERVSESGDVIQASVPIGSLDAIAGLQAVRAVTTPSYGHVNVGSQLTEGDALLGFDAVRSTYGVSGAGVTIGVISDGIFGLGDAIASGDLPATTLTRDAGGKLISTSGGVIATSFRADGDLEGGLGGGTGAEGTAMLEIVHDIAPGAQLRFANFATELEFIAAVDFLAANSDVVVDDIGFFTGHYDQTSPVSTNTADELNRPGNAIRGYYNAVGNQATSHYQEGFLPASTCFVSAPHTCHEFSATADTTNAFSGSIGAVPANPVFVSAGRTVIVILSWDDSFGNTTSDYDLLLFQENPFDLVAVGGDDNTVTGEPTEFLVFTNQTGVGKWYDIVVVNFLGASAPHTLDMFVLGGATLFNDTRINFNTVRSSVPDQSDAGGGVVSAGAIDSADPGIDDAEPFSSRGPTNNGALKPDV